MSENDTTASDRLMMYGTDMLGDAELLTEATGMARDATLAVLDAAGGIEGMVQMAIPELAAAGLTLPSARAFFAMMELIRRSAVNPMATVVRGPDDAAKYVQRLIGDSMQEKMMIIGFDPRNRVRLVRTVFVGSLAKVDTHPREMLRPLVQHALHSFIMAHCHPSGDCDPSESDVLMTKRMAEAGRILGIPLLDHIIVTRTSYYAMAAHGFLGD